MSHFFAIGPIYTTASVYMQKVDALLSPWPGYAIHPYSPVVATGFKLLAWFSFAAALLAFVLGIIVRIQQWILRDQK